MKNNHAYLRLPKILVKKEEVGFLLSKYDKIEIQKSLNKGLKNPKIVKIIPYLYIDFGDLTTILGCCKKYEHLCIPVLTGVQSSKESISYKTIKKLLIIEKDRDLSLSISKDIKNKIL